MPRLTVCCTCIHFYWRSQYSSKVCSCVGNLKLESSSLSKHCQNPQKHSLGLKTFSESVYSCGMNFSSLNLFQLIWPMPHALKMELVFTSETGKFKSKVTYKIYFCNQIVKILTSEMLLSSCGGSQLAVAIDAYPCIHLSVKTYF